MANDGSTSRVEGPAVEGGDPGAVVPRARPAAGAGFQAWLLAGLARAPLPLLHAVAGLLAGFAKNILRYRRGVVLENLAIAFPECTPEAREQLLAAFYRNAADVLVETIKGRTIDRAALGDRVVITNLDLMERYARAGQSIILLGSHEANWEWVFLACTARLPFAMEAVYKPLHGAGVDAFMLATRSRFGATLVPPRSALRTFTKDPGRPRAIGIIPDQRPAGDEPMRWVSFLGRETPFSTGFETLARLARCPVLFCARRRTARGHYEVTFEVIGEPPWGPGEPALVERYAEALERSVRAHPADWLWTHRRWKTRRPLYD